MLKKIVNLISQILRSVYQIISKIFNYETDFNTSRFF